jgi:hypothetical protein
MGNPSYSEQQELIKKDSKRFMEEFTAWYNTIEYENDDIEAATLREIMADCTYRLQLVLEMIEERKGSV